MQTKIIKTCHGLKRITIADNAVVWPPGEVLTQLDQMIEKETQYWKEFFRAPFNVTLQKLTTPLARALFVSSAKKS